MSSEIQTKSSQQAAPVAKGELLARTLANAFVDQHAQSSSKGGDAVGGGK